MHSTEVMVELQVKSGRHCGIVEHLGVGSYLIGSSIDADLSLVDEEVDAIQARMALDQAGVRVERLSGSVLLNGDAIEDSCVGTSGYPADLVLNGIQLRCDCPGRQPERAKLGKWLLIVGAASSVVAVSLAAASVTAGYRRDLAEPLSSGVGNAEITSAVGPAGSNARKVNGPAALPPSTLEAAAEGLRQRLIADGLRSIEVAVDATAVVARGSVDPGAVQGWYAVRQWFDQTYGAGIVLNSQVEGRSVRAARAPISPQAIWAGETPYVIDQGGQKHFEGSLLDGGWTIKQIELGRITLGRSGEVLVLRL